MAHHVDRVCHSKIERTVRHLGIEVDAAIRNHRAADATAIEADVAGDGL